MFTDETTFISTYTRAQAIEDEALVDVSPIAKHLYRFNYPVALTDTVWLQYVRWKERDTKRQGAAQDEIGRLKNILCSLWIAFYCNGERNILYFKVDVIPCDGHSRSLQTVTLKSVIERGDNGEPVITIMDKDAD